MSRDVIQVIAALDDGALCELFQAIESHFGREDVHARFGNAVTKGDSVYNVLAQRMSRNCQEIGLRTSDAKFVVTVRRGLSTRNTDGAVRHDSRTPSPYFDEVQIVTKNDGQSTTHNPTYDECSSLSDIVSSFARIATPPPAAEQLAQSVTVVQAEVASLAAIHRKMIRDAGGLTQKLHEESLKRREETEAALATLREAHNEELARTQAILNERESEIEARRKELDDRDHMHARRELRKDITDQISKRISKDMVDARSRSLHLVVTFASTFSAIASAGYAVWTFYEFSHLTVDDIRSSTAFGEYLPWALLARGSIATAASLGFVVFTLNWLRRAYIENMRATNDLQRYALDLNRSSWIIETIMEFHAKDKGDLPDKWVQGVCFGLFDPIESDRPETSPIEAWSALLRSSGNAEIGPGGWKIGWNGSRQTNKLAKGPDEV